ncbi:phosphatase PAP2 family protein [Streptomyces massasporeus]|uniref:phosphatase PAP2 family protein n=1 Tax=Streptomyces massasporeus TaxID=67324 RepID=UPI003F541915
MSVPALTRETDRRLAKWLAAGASPCVHRVLSVVEEMAEGTKLWCGAAAVMVSLGGRRGRKAAAAGLAAVALAQLASNGVCKQLADRPRPPKEWFPHDETEDRPDSSSFPSGHTAAAVAFTAAVAPTWPLAGAVCAVPAAMVAVERVQSGAHYPSDVAVGAAIGLTGAWLIRRAPNLMLRYWLQQRGVAPFAHLPYRPELPEAGSHRDRLLA